MNNNAKQLKTDLIRYKWDSYYLQNNKKRSVPMSLDMMFFLYFLTIKPNHVYNTDNYDPLWSNVTITDILKQLHFITESSKGCELTQLGKRYVHYAFPALFRTYVQEPEIQNQIAGQKRHKALDKQRQKLHKSEHKIDILKHPKHSLWYKADILGLWIMSILMIGLFIHQSIFLSAVCLVGFMSLLAGYIMNKIMTYIINQPDVNDSERKIIRLRYKIYGINHRKLTASHFGTRANQIARSSIKSHPNHINADDNKILSLDIKQLTVKYDDYITNLDNVDRERFKRFVIRHQNDKLLDKSSFIYFLIKQDVYKQTNNIFDYYQTLIDRSLYMANREPSAMMLFSRYMIDHGMIF